MKEFVLNNSTFWEFIRNLRNDERVKHGFIKQGEITKKDHKKYCPEIDWKQPPLKIYETTRRQVLYLLGRY